MNLEATLIFLFSLPLNLCFKPNLEPIPKIMDLEKHIEKTVHIRDMDFEIYCFLGEEKSLPKIWKTIYFRLLEVDLNNVQIFKGNNEKDIFNEYKSASSSWFNINPWKSQKIKIATFNKSCIGILTTEKYKIRLEETRIDYWRVTLMVTGIILFIFAPVLSRNAFFHYIAGVSLGLTTSVLLIIFLVSRMVPKRSGAVSVLIGGWAVVLYLIQYVWSNIQQFLYSHSNYVTAYIIIIGLSSFAVCYRYGPVTNPRTVNLIRWALQGTGLVSVAFSSDWQEIGIVFSIILILAYNFPQWLLSYIKIYWKRKFPPKIRLLSEEEYHEQGYNETKKALDELRKHCNSPECSPWRLLSRIHSDPYRFASFVEGASHLSDEEILNYEQCGVNEFDDNEYTNA